MESAKNVAASAKAGMEKTKATMQEKAEKVATRDPLQKEIAAERKEERVHEAERQKLEAKQAARAGTGGVHVPSHGMGGGQAVTPEAGTGVGSGGVVATDPTVGAGGATRARGAGRRGIIN